jgi:hypothetical protein
MTGNTKRFIDAARSRANEEERRQITSLQSPVVAEVLGRNLAAELHERRPGAIVVWDQVETAVLGHVVARELGANLVYAYSVGGALGISEGLVAGARVVLVSYDWSEDPGMSALTRFVESQGGTISGIGSVLGTVGDAAQGIDIVSLEAAGSTPEA